MTQSQQLARTRQSDGALLAHGQSTVLAVGPGVIRHLLSDVVADPNWERLLILQGALRVLGTMDRDIWDAITSFAIDGTQALDFRVAMASMVLEPSLFRGAPYYDAVSSFAKRVSTEKRLSGARWDAQRFLDVAQRRTKARWWMSEGTLLLPDSVMNGLSTGPDSCDPAAVCGDTQRAVEAILDSVCFQFDRTFSRFAQSSFLCYEFLRQYEPVAGTDVYVSMPGCPFYSAIHKRFVQLLSLWSFRVGSTEQYTLHDVRVA